MKAITLSIKTLIPALLVGGAMLQGCDGTPKSKAAKGTGICFESIDIEKAYSLENSASDFDNETDLSAGCKAELVLPTEYLGEDIKAFRDSIFRIAFDTITPDASTAIESYFLNKCEDMGYSPAALDVTKATADSLASSKASLNNYDGFVGVKGDVAALTSEYISYGVTLSAYYPRAAHGMYTTQYVTYSATAGKVVTLDELFTQEGLAALPAILRNRANSMKGYIGETNVNELPSGNNFYINTNGEIVFVYQPYEVASYAQGRISIPVEPYSVNNYLSPLGAKVLLGE